MINLIGAEEPQRPRPPLLNFLSLRRMSVPGLFRSLDAAPATREPPQERDPPRTVLERISNSGASYFVVVGSLWAVTKSGTHRETLNAPVGGLSRLL